MSFFEGIYVQCEQILKLFFFSNPEITLPVVGCRTRKCNDVYAGLTNTYHEASAVVRNGFECYSLSLRFQEHCNVVLNVVQCYCIKGIQLFL